MNMPGFTAEASLYQSTGHYSVTFSSTATRAGAVVPTFFAPCASICAVCITSLFANPLLDPVDVVACIWCMLCEGIV